MKHKNRHQLVEELPVWPFALQWFTMGWVLPEVILGLMDKESSYIPGAHGRLIVATGGEVVRDDDGHCYIKVPKFPLPFEVDFDDVRIGTGEYNLSLAIRTEDSIETWFLESNESAEETLSAALGVLSTEFLREMVTDDNALEFVQFAIDHYPGLLDQEAVLTAFLMAAAAE
jgi:hypothetical protein